MTLMIISLLLHGVTFLWILTLMQRLQQPDASKAEIEQMKNEMEDLLISYTAEMKEENERLLRQLELRNRVDKGSERVPSQEQQSMEAEARVERVKVKQGKQEQAKQERYEEYTPPFIDELKEDIYYEQSDTAKVLALAEQGLSVEQIAKKLNIGKGEVELLLKFYR